jgi:hypothetical protein
MTSSARPAILEHAAPRVRGICDRANVARRGIEMRLRTPVFRQATRHVRAGGDRAWCRYGRGAHAPAKPARPAFGLAVADRRVERTSRGAHVNPAVTIGFWSVGRFRSSNVIPYVAAQCVGAVLASLLCGWLVGPVGGFGATIPSLPIAQSFVVEMGFTGILGFVIMAVATDDRTPSAVAPFAIGSTVFAGALVTGPLTGGSFNPARSLGPRQLRREFRTAHWL